MRCNRAGGIGELEGSGADAPRHAARIGGGDIGRAEKRMHALATFEMIGPDDTVGTLGDRQPDGRGHVDRRDLRDFRDARAWAGGGARTRCRNMPVDDRADNFESVLKPVWLRAQSGDEAAYRQALALLARRLRGFLGRRLSGLPDEVEDLVQETLLALHLQRGTYDPKVPVSAWATAIARHKLVDLWRRRGRRDTLHDALDDVDECLLVSDVHDGGARRDLQVLLQELPLAQQQAIVLTKLEGLSVAEAASRTGSSESAIKVQVHRGLKRLAALVRQDPTQ
jgi:RNA polymerase sigma-70 factor (ECF subfamily)